MRTIQSLPLLGLLLTAAACAPAVSDSAVEGESAAALTKTSLDLTIAGPPFIPQSTTVACPGDLDIETCVDSVEGDKTAAFDYRVVAVFSPTVGVRGEVHYLPGRACATQHVANPGPTEQLVQIAIPNGQATMQSIRSVTFKGSILCKSTSSAQPTTPAAPQPAPRCTGEADACASSCNAGCAKAKACTGSPKSCFEHILSNLCLLQGCLWDDSDAACYGSAPPCAERPESYCELAVGCSLQDTCIGTPTACEDLDPSECTAQVGCHLA